MATWPHEPTKLSDAEKKAYRNLLYWAMLDIRMLCQPRTPATNNPLKWRRQYEHSRIAGALADWLHNLAQHAATDFNHFDTEWFWREYDGVSKRFAGLGAGQWMDYRQRYEEHLDRLNAVEPPQRNLEKPDVIGKRIADVIILKPDIPISMSSQSYSPGFLRLETGEVFDLGSDAPPLLACDEMQFKNAARDTEYENEFRPAIGQIILNLLFPDETEEGSINVITANGYLINSVAAVFWTRPCINKVEK
jgi:hypothetical protein